MNQYNYFKELAHSKKIIQCFANTVTANECANLLLAAGASPIMADDVVGSVEFAEKVDALTINIGTPASWSDEAMLSALTIANRRNIPSVLDPVGCGFAASHTDLSLKLLNKGVSVLRCNQSEAKALMGEISSACGVDVSPDDIVTENNLADRQQDIIQIAKTYHCVTAVTGAIDIVADPNGQVMAIRGGHPIMERVTGTGCMLSALLGAFVACSPDNIFDAVVSCLTIYGFAGEQAYASLRRYEGSGTFATRLIDMIYQFSQGAENE